MILGWNNLVTGATLAASSAASGMPVTNLQDDTGSSSVAWQTASGTMSATLTVTAAQTGSTWRSFGVFKTNFTTGASMTVALYTNPSTLVWTGSASGLVAGYGQIVLDAGANKTADYAIVTLSDLGNPDGFLNVPLAFLGPVWKPAIGPSWQTAQGRDASVSETISRGGQEYPRFWWSRRRVELAMDGIAGTELWSDAQEADRISRTGANILLIPNETSDDLQTEAIFGRLNVTADFTYPVKNATRFAWRARLTERI